MNMREGALEGITSLPYFCFFPLMWLMVCHVFPYATHMSNVCLRRKPYALQVFPNLPDYAQNPAMNTRLAALSSHTFKRLFQLQQNASAEALRLLVICGSRFAVQLATTINSHCLEKQGVCSYTGAATLLYETLVGLQAQSACMN